MRLADTRQGYGLVTIALHWLVAGFTVYLFVNGHDLEEGDERGREGLARAVGNGARAVGEGARQFSEGARQFAEGGREFIAANIFNPRALHISIGVIAIVFIVGRIIWRMTQGSPPKGNESPLLNVVAVAVQWGLLLALLVLAVSGPMLAWSAGQPIRVFDWFAIPSPGIPFAIRRTVQIVHSLAANALVPLVGLHILGALKHAFIDRDGVLRRMLVPAQG
jgi:cytochrome b561